MKRYLTIVVLLLATFPLCAQNIRKDDIALQTIIQNSSVGTVSFLKPIAGAVITVGLGPSSCSVLNSPSGSTASCSPLASLCSSQTDTVCNQPNPTNADANGNYGFWLKPQRYNVAVTGIGVNGKVLTYDLPVGLLDSGSASLPNNVQGTGGLLTLFSGPDTFVGRNTTDILTNKTLTSPAINNPTISGIGPRFQQFTSSGTFTIPSNVTVVKVTVVGGGGAGGGATAGNNGSGGGGGSYATKWLSGLTPGNTLTVTIGPGGTGVSGANGNNGTGSTVSSGTQTITSIVTNGGIGGFSTGTAQAGGAGGVAGTGGDLNIAGGGGNNTDTAVSGGQGGMSLFPGLNGGFSCGNAINAGTGGNGCNSGGTLTGGNGASGIVIFEWVI